MSKTYYTSNDIREAYRKIGVGKGSVVLLKTDMRFLGYFESLKKEEILKAHYNVLADIIDLSKGTIVVSTSSTNLCNSDIPFDLQKTPSERGVFTEYIRTRRKAIRSFHPFVSYAAIGKDAEKICTNVSRHAYGPETPKERLLELDALYVSMGLSPNLTCSLVHHVEFIMGVPYRYVKEFIHPVVRDAKAVWEPFYMYVYYRECDIKRNRNIKIFDRFSREGYTVKESSLGRGKLYGYAMRDFYKCAVKAFKDDIYIWLDRPPEIRPYQR